MSLSVDGIWKAGVWATTVWGDDVWREGDPPALPIILTANVLPEDAEFKVTSSDRTLLTLADEQPKVLVEDQTIRVPSS